MLFPSFGKFVSDSVEIVFASSELIGKAAGVVALVAVIFVLIIPIIRILITVLITSFMVVFAQALGADEKIVKIIDNFNSTYKTVMGVLISTSITFIVAIAVMVSIIGKVTS